MTCGELAPTTEQPPCMCRVLPHTYEAHSRVTAVKRSAIVLFVLALMLAGLPLVGLLLAGVPISPYLEFPPRTAYVAHAPFSWGAFAAITLLVGISLAPFVYRVVRSGVKGGPGVKRGQSYPPFREAEQAAGMGESNSDPFSPFPWWGWLGIALLALSWWFAWNRFTWFAPFQAFTFSPIWLGYIVLVNALALKRTGRCMLRDRPYYFLALFPLSAAFWWCFEYLNRFVQNWHYHGVGPLGAWDYFWQATLPFATVLPAVLGTREWLATFPRLSGGLASAWCARPFHSRSIAWALLVVAGVGLSVIGIWPNALFSLLWLSPLLLVTCLQIISGESSILDSPANGDWRELWLAALAGLACGFLWELWNSQSLAHWEYSVPFVHRFEVFEMPLLGYAGYLPFGLECIAAARLLDAVWGSAQLLPERSGAEMRGK